MTKEETTDIIKKIEMAMQGVASERNKLDALIGEAEHLRDNCMAAYDCLQEARDVLSELV